MKAATPPSGAWMVSQRAEWSLSLRRRPDPDDLRSKRVALTPRGTSAIGVIRDAVEEVEVAWARQLGAERFAELRNLLLELNELT